MSESLTAREAAGARITVRLKELRLELDPVQAQRVQEALQHIHEQQDTSVVCFTALWKAFNVFRCILENEFQVEP